LLALRAGKDNREHHETRENEVAGMSQFMFGAIGMGFAVSGFFFLRFWRQTRDRLFALFALAFFVLAANRFGIALVERHEVMRGDYLYWVRFLAFALILMAIVDKNRSQHKPNP